MKLSNKFKSLNHLSNLVKNNTSIGIGGHHFARLPIALINKVLSHNPKNLEFISWSGGLALELFLQKNSINKIQVCFSSLDIFGLAPTFRKISEAKSIEVIDWSALGLIKALRASQQNIDSEIFQYPWGSDLPNKTKFCKKFKDPKTKNEFAIVNSITIDNFLLHASRADEDGNVEILGPRALDTIMAGASKQVIVTVDEIVSRDILAKEKLCPVIAIVPYSTFENAVAMAKANLLVEGAGHSAALHSNDEENIQMAGIELPISRLVVNQPSSTTAGGSLTNGFAPTTTLGCGSWGGNSISENLDYKHLMNISRIGKVIVDKEVPSDEEIWT